MDACLQAIQQAVAYISRHANEVRSGLTATVTHPGDADYRRLRKQVDAAALAGNVQATKRACKALWEYVLQHEAKEPSRVA